MLLNMVFFLGCGLSIKLIFLFYKIFCDEKIYSFINGVVEIM